MNTTLTSIYISVPNITIVDLFFIIPCIYIVRQDIVAIVIILIIVIQMVIIDVSGLIMTFTPERLVNLIYPKILQTQLVSYARFIEYGELYTLFQVIGGWMMKYIVTFQAILILLKELNLKKKTLIYNTYITSIVVFILANIAGYNTFLMFDLLNYYSYICLINFVVIPFLIFMRYSMVARKIAKNSQ